MLSPQLFTNNPKLLGNSARSLIAGRVGGKFPADDRPGLLGTWSFDKLVEVGKRWGCRVQDLGFRV
jgi:hypothetical protein